MVLFVRPALGLEEARCVHGGGNWVVAQGAQVVCQGLGDLNVPAAEARQQRLEVALLQIGRPARSALVDEHAVEERETL